MDRKFKILAVCGFGVGTSLILKMNIEKAMGQLGIAFKSLLAVWPAKNS